MVLKEYIYFRFFLDNVKFKVQVFFLILLASPFMSIALILRIQHYGYNLPVILDHIIISYASFYMYNQVQFCNC